MGIVMTNEKGEFVLFNEAAAQILGIGKLSVNPDEWPDRYGVYDPQTGEKLSSTSLPLYRALAGETVSNKQMTIRNHQRPDGVLITTDAKPLFNRKGDLRGAVVYFKLR
jgi:PAS domain-containing protein